MLLKAHSSAQAQMVHFFHIDPRVWTSLTGSLRTLELPQSTFSYPNLPEPTRTYHNLLFPTKTYQNLPKTTLGESQTFNCPHYWPTSQVNKALPIFLQLLHWCQVASTVQTWVVHRPGSKLWVHSYVYCLHICHSSHIYIYVYVYMYMS